MIKMTKAIATAIKPMRKRNNENCSEIYGHMKMLILIPTTTTTLMTTKKKRMK